MKLRTKIIIFTVLIWILSITIFQLISSNYFKKQTALNISNELNNVTVIVSDHAKNTVDNASVDMQFFETLPFFSQYIDYNFFGLKKEANIEKTFIKEIFDDVLVKRPAYLYLKFFDNNGNTIVLSKADKLRSSLIYHHYKINKIDKKLSLSFKKSGNTNVFISNVFFNKQFNTYAMRFRLDLKHNGIILLEVSLNKMFSSLNKLKLYLNSSIYITNASDSNNIIFRTKSFSGNFINNNKVKFLKSTQSKLLFTDWNLYLLTPYSQTYFLVKLLKENSLLIVALIILITCFISIYLSNSLSKPTNKIISLMKDYGKDLTKKIKFTPELKKSGYEFKTIANCLDDMIDKITNHNQKITDLAKYKILGKTARIIDQNIQQPLENIKVLRNSISQLTEIPMQLKQVTDNLDTRLKTNKKILTELLEFAKEKKDLKKGNFNPQSIITSALSTVLRDKTDITIEIDYDMQHKNYLDVDAYFIIKAFCQIISNAICAMQGNGKLWFKTCDHNINSKENPYLKIIIGNNGPTIPRGIVDKIFEPFFSKNKENGIGLGLGLSMCKKFIEANDGQISVFNFYNKSSVEFTIILPALKGRLKINKNELIYNSNELIQFKNQECKRKIYDDDVNISDFIDLHKKQEKVTRLLIIDDDTLFRTIVKNFISAIPQVKGCLEFFETERAEYALNLLEEKSFDYIITDIDLGITRMNGYEFTKIVLEKYPKTHIVISSNKRKIEMDEIIEKSKTSFFMGFLQKPIKKSELLQFLACKPF